MLRSSIRIKILSITIGLIVLMLGTAILSLVLVQQVDRRLEQLTKSYIPVYGALARTNIRSLERALALRRMIIARTVSPPDTVSYRTSHDVLLAKGADVQREGETARALISSLISDRQSLVDEIALAKLEARIEVALEESHRDLDAAIDRLLPLLSEGTPTSVGGMLANIDGLRDTFQAKIESIRSDTLALVQRNAAETLQQQRRLLTAALALTALSAAIGLAFSIVISGGMVRPVRRLLDGARAVEAGDLTATLAPTTVDEIGHLTTAFNRMVEQLRLKEQVRATFGKYVDPRIVAGLLDRAELSADGERRVMTVLFCDLTNFTRISEGLTPSALLRLMNRYLSLMSEPIRTHQGIIDKYIGDAIMAYWGPPFTQADEQARLACLAALDMSAQVTRLREELPELTGFRHVPFEIDIRIGIATGDVVVGSLGSEYLKNYTVLGDTANLASRLESANKVYNTRLLISAATAAAVVDDVELREIDRVVVAGQSTAQAIFEVMGRKGDLTVQQTQLMTHYAFGLAAYRMGAWTKALAALAEALKAVPEDGPSAVLSRRITELAAEPPGPEWDASWRLTAK